MSTRKLLLADDSITIQKVVNLTFADEGIEVISVADGNSALEKISEISPDLVMADVNMPGLSGYQVCERIKQDDSFRQTPVILLVGSFEPFDEEEARRVGADDFLTKPFQSIRQLVSKVTVLLDSNDKNAAQLYHATANNSFADTLEMEKSEDEFEPKHYDNYSDAGMDDEMIQTNQVNHFALDESAKFETKEVSDASEDHGKTQPLSVYDLKEFSFVASSNEENQGSEIASEPESESKVSDENNFDKNLKSEETGKSFSPFIDSYEDDLLEIPFDEEEDEPEQDEEIAPAAPAEIVTPEDHVEEKTEYSSEQVFPTEDNSRQDEYQSQNEIVVGTLTEPETQTERSAETTENWQTIKSSNEFPPELIEAVAQRVIEKLSDQAVREIAWEIVPQHADLVIKKMVEERLKE